MRAILAFSVVTGLLSSAELIDAQQLTPSSFNETVSKISPDTAKANVQALRKFLPKIIGGTDAKPGEFPYQVSLMISSQYSQSPGIDRHFCGGSIIGDQWVLTAAHCTVDMIGTSKYYSVGAGGIDLNKLEEYEVDGTWVHPMYDGESFDYDFAILHVRTPFFDPAIGVADKSDNQYINVGNPATITGWGVDDSGNIQQILKKADVKVISRNDCNDTDSYQGAVTARMICLGLPAGGKDTCQGDSGGPAVTPGQGGTRVLFGNTSWGEGCAQSQKYGVYGRVISVRDWIETTTGGLDE